MSDLTRALVFAAEAHCGQVDKGGHPYILHPLRVMLRMTTEQERIVALLHDVIEDTELDWDDLPFYGEERDAIRVLSRNELKRRETRFSPRVSLTPRRYRQTYEEYLEGVKANPLARRAKLADLEDNMDLTRIPNPTEKDFARIAKYKRAKEFLLAE